jgi:hypothetical protein
MRVAAFHSWHIHYSRIADMHDYQATRHPCCTQGLKYVLPVRPGGRTRGIRTGFAAAPLSSHFRVSDDDPDIPVWPDPEGELPSDDASQARLPLLVQRLEQIAALASPKSH